MSTFIKWFLINAVMATALFLVEQKGMVSSVFKNDLSYISLLIMVLYVGVSLYIGRLCYLADKINEKRKKEAIHHLEQRSELGWFTAEHFFSLGLLGTIIGLVIATHGNLDSSLPTSAIVAGLKKGLNTAFYTTICGIIFSLPLQIQLMVLKHKLNEDHNEK
jgi:Ca2+/Na+ antiporter|tara:strand:+ start:1746 stop:2231 length:486 start_codon:yes stop_codon:yes gene_type:complete